MGAEVLSGPDDTLLFSFSLNSDSNNISVLLSNRYLNLECDIDDWQLIVVGKGDSVFFRSVVL